MSGGEAGATGAIEARATGLLRLEAVPGASPLGAIFAGSAVLGGALTALLRLDRIPLTLCYFKALTGLPCLTCGSTRALGRLAALDFAGALFMNPLAALGLLAVLAWGLADLVLLPAGRALRVSVAPPVRPWLRGLALAAVALNWVFLLIAGR